MADREQINFAPVASRHTHKLYKIKNCVPQLKNFIPVNNKIKKNTVMIQNVNHLIACIFHNTLVTYSTVQFHHKLEEFYVLI